jgi:phage terminase small subunit
MEDNLTGKQLRYVENIAKGMSLRDAALKAGYSLSFSKVAAGRLGQSPAVARRLLESERRREKLLAMTFQLRWMRPWMRSPLHEPRATRWLS